MRGISVLVFIIKVIDVLKEIIKLVIKILFGENSLWIIYNIIGKDFSIC